MAVGVKVAFAAVVLLNCAVDVFGPVTIDQTPVPVVCEAASVVPPVQIV